MEGEAGITQKELAGLRNRRIATKKAEREEIPHKYKNLKGGVEIAEFANKEIENEVEMGDLEDLIIDRSKKHGEINTQIDSTAGEFQQLEENKEDE